MVNSPKKKCCLRLERLEARDCPTAGALDLDFGGTGIVFADFGVGRDSGSSVAIQPDGKIIVAGTSTQPVPPRKNQPPQTQSDFALARFNVDGTLDTAFGIEGTVLTDSRSGSNDIAGAVAVQSDGKIVVGGSSDGKFALARYNSNGTLDTAFDSDGKVTTSLAGTLSQLGGGMVLQADGKILLGGKWRSSSGSSGFALVRYKDNGSLDKSFDGDGISTSVLTSSSVPNDSLGSLALQSNGRIVAAGSSGGVATLARYNVNGSLDTSFGGGDGHVEFIDSISWYDVTMQSDRIVVAGTSNPSTPDPVRHPLLARYDSTGALDPTFGSSGLVVETSQPGRGDYFGVEIQADGKIVAAGDATVSSIVGAYPDAWSVARYSEDGVLDTSFGGDGSVVTDTTSENLGDDVARDLAIQADGKIVAAGISHDASGNHFFAVVRYLGDDPAPPPAAATPAKISKQTITQAEITPLLTEAIRRWQSAGFDIAPLTNMQVRIADLGGTTLGLASGHTIWLDDNAAGWGWFVDQTPWDEAEFTTPGDPLTPTPLPVGEGQRVRARMDLLSVLMHEVGHLLGYEHGEPGASATGASTTGVPPTGASATGDVMKEKLSPGERLSLHTDDTLESRWLMGLPGLTKKRDPLRWWL